MPLYDWKCRDCGYEYELMGTIGQQLATCPRCSQLSGEKVPSAPPVHFKGAGWTPKSGKGRSE